MQVMQHVKSFYDILASSELFKLIALHKKVIIDARLHDVTVKRFPDASRKKLCHETKQGIHAKKK